MNIEQIKEAIKELKAKQNPKVDYGSMVCAEGFACGMHYVWEDPLDYAIETALECLQSELNRLENKPLTLNELKEMVGEPVWCEFNDENRTIIKKVIINDMDEKFITGVTACGAKIWIPISDRKFYKHRPDGKDIK